VKRNEKKGRQKSPVDEMRQGRGPIAWFRVNSLQVIASGDKGGVVTPEFLLTAPELPSLDVVVVVYCGCLGYKIASGSARRNSGILRRSGCPGRRSTKGTMWIGAWISLQSRSGRDEYAQLDNRNEYTRKSVRVRPAAVDCRSNITDWLTDWRPVFRVG
jgi:hypothetical protein